ncbi:MAG: hypothetical protein J6A75_06740 [Lachnospiraceae bacterium]|nr:hypothetical protein [Lachnospiraceae bacterium]
MGWLVYLCVLAFALVYCPVIGGIMIIAPIAIFIYREMHPSEIEKRKFYNKKGASA